MTDLQAATDLLAMMDDGLTRLRLNLVWGSQYCVAMAEWEAALEWLDKARAQLEVLQKTGGTAVPESVQLRIGLAQIALHTRQWPQASSLLAAAQNEATAHHLIWLQPALDYWQGMAYTAVGMRSLR
ncbi:MAG: hypothetical protein HC804_12925 [Anaerolineae bacterium]|nr:hypothetical protein [Anaerolineae bacterium]